MASCSLRRLDAASTWLVSALCGEHTLTPCGVGVHSRCSNLPILHSSCSFYGTLMHPKILKRVIQNDVSHRQICPAVLLNLTSHRIKFSECPGIVPGSGHESHNEIEHNVHGMLVTGLTKSDLVFLNAFEGSDYTRERVQVEAFVALVAIADYTPTELPAPRLMPSVPADTYVYNKIARLVPEVWDFADLIEKNLWRWDGLRGGVSGNGKSNRELGLVSRSGRRPRETKIDSLGLLKMF
ncbi:hypothetical protein C8R43DRAFT_885818 [Mycena crocata]|nr:hypothetical protein C8R43DRAFT_885818 [Mycena crocata]